MTKSHSYIYPEMSSEDMELLRRLTPAQKLAIVGRLYRAMRAQLLSDLQTQCLEETPEKIKRPLADVLLGTDLAHKVYDKTDVYRGFDPDNPTEQSILEGLRQSLQQALDGNTRPISELWAELNQDLC